MPPWESDEVMEAGASSYYFSSLLVSLREATSSAAAFATSTSLHLPRCKCKCESQMPPDVGAARRSVLR